MSITMPVSAAQWSDASVSIRGMINGTFLGMGKGEVGNTSQEMYKKWTKELCLFVTKITYFSSVPQIALTYLGPAHVS